jgi:methyl-accepting chemotaxis protein
MLVTIRARLIGFSILSLLIVVLVGGVGYYGKSELRDAIEYMQGKLVLANTSMRVNLAQDEIRADVLQILREAKGVETPAYKEEVKNLDEHLKTLSSNTAKILNTTDLSEKFRQAVVLERADIEVYAKSAKDIASLAPIDAAGSEKLFDDFNEKYKKLKHDQLLLDNLITEEIEGTRQAADDASMRATYKIIAVVGAALILLALCSYSIYRGIMGSLNRLRQAIAKVEAGNYQVRVNLNIRDEIGALGRSFDTLVCSGLWGRCPKKT